MKKNRKGGSLLGLLVLFFAVCFCSGCRGCSNMKLNSQKDGMLWEISGNGLSHKSYLFGTMLVAGITLHRKKSSRRFLSCVRS